MVLPAGRASRAAGQAPDRETGQAAETTLDRETTAGLVDHPEGLMEPDRDPRPDPQDERVGEPRLWLGQRSRARVLLIPAVTEGTPSQWEVAVEIHAASVLAGPGGHPVGVEGMEDPDRAQSRRASAEERSHHAETGGLITVDGAHHEKGARGARSPSTVTRIERPCTDRPTTSSWRGQHGERIARGRSARAAGRRPESTSSRLTPVMMSTTATAPVAVHA